MKILIAEDETSIANALKVMLTKEKYVVDVVYNGKDALDYITLFSYDILILDIMMPRLDGITVLKEARNKGITTPTLFLTAKSDIDDRVEGLDAGADDYLTKPFEIAELIVRVRALLKRSSKIPKSTAVRDLLTYKEVTLLPETYSVQINEKVQKLTPIEFDIFNLLFQNHGNMVSGQKLLKEVWGYEPDDSVETIRVHIRHLRSKIDKISAGKKYIETIYGGGYKLNI